MAEYTIHENMQRFHVVAGDYQQRGFGIASWIDRIEAPDAQTAAVMFSHRTQRHTAVIVPVREGVWELK